MLELVIEKKFLEGFTNRYDKKNKLHNDFASFLEYTASPLTLYTDIEMSDISKCTIDGVSNHFLELLANSKSFTTIYCTQSEMLAEEFLLNNNTFKIFFLDLGETRCAELSKQYGFEFICLGNFNMVWPYYYSNNKDRQMWFNVTNNVKITPRFDTWNKLNEFKHSIISIIVSDPYLLTDVEKISTNINSILATLLINAGTVPEIEVLIFTTDDPKKILLNSAWQKRFDLLQKSMQNGKRVKMVLFRYPNNIADHARGIFTNYWYIKPGNSLNFFDKNGKMTKVKDDIEFSHIFYKSTVAILKERILDISDFITHSADEPEKMGQQEGKKRVFSNFNMKPGYQFKLMESLKNFVS